MDVLFTGNVAPVSEGFFHNMSEECKCVIYSDHFHEMRKMKQVCAYQNTDENDLEKVFGTFDFHTVVYFSKALDGALKVFDELEKLESVLFMCKRKGVHNVIYVTTNDLNDYAEEDQKNGSRHILMQACEDMCISFAAAGAMNMIVLRVPYLYSCYEADNQVNRWIQEILKTQKMLIQGAASAMTDFLCDSDLGTLISRMIDEPYDKGYLDMNISGENPMDFAQAAGIICETVTQNVKLPEAAEPQYCNSIMAIPQFDKDAKARKEYGWFARHVFKDDMDRVLQKYGKKTQQKQRSGRALTEFRKIKEKLRIAIEVVVLFIAATLLNRWTSNNVILNFIDFRLLYTLMIGMMNGLNAGIAAAVLSCIGYVGDNVNFVQWQVWFYNVQNWLPFACYFLIGSISGYRKDKYDDDIAFAKEQQDILEQKYIFLNELYTRALDNKNEFNSQIIGYKDSFGRMYSIVKKLDSTLADQVFYEAVNILEDTLENPYVAIYSVNDNSDFARLNICSKRLYNEIGKSLRLSDYPEMMQEIRKNQVFVNLEGLSNYPTYAAPIYGEGTLIGLILLQHIEDHQMNMEYSNKFKIIAELIRDSMIRAIDYDAMTQDENYIEDTRILRAGKFAEIVKVKKEMRRDDLADYLLVKIRQENRSLRELSEILSGMIRNNDVLGQGEDGAVYLLLAQTNATGMDIIRDRMRKRGIEFDVV